MQQPKFVVQKIEIEMLALSRLRHQPGLFALPIAANGKGAARLHTRQYANQAGGNLVALNELAHELFLGFLRRVQMNQWASAFVRHLLCTFFKRLESRCTNALKSLCSTR